MKQMENKSWKDMLSNHEVEPNPDLWNNIEGKLNRKNTLFFRKRYFSVAAMLIAFLGSGYLINLQLSEGDQPKVISQINTPSSTTEIPRIQSSLLPSFKEQILHSKQKLAKIKNGHGIQFAYAQSTSTPNAANIVEQSKNAESNPINEETVHQQPATIANESTGTPHQEKTLKGFLKDKESEEPSQLAENPESSEIENYWEPQVTEKTTNSNWIIASNLSLPNNGNSSNSNSVKTSLFDWENTDVPTFLPEQNLRRYTYSSRIETEIVAVKQIQGALSIVTGLHYFVENGNYQQENRTGTLNINELPGNYKYEQISIPLGLRYQLFRKTKFNSYIQSTYNLSVSQEYSNSITRTDLSDLYSKDHISLGVGLEYRFLNWIGIFAEPSFIQGIGKSNDHRTSIKTGLNIHF